MLHSEDQRVVNIYVCSPFFICLLHCAHFVHLWKNEIYYPQQMYN